MDERSVAVEVVPERQEDVAAVEDGFPSLREEIAVRGGVTLAGREEGRYGARFTVAADEPSEAVDEGVAVLEEAADAAGVPRGRVVDVEAPTLEELGHAEGSDLPELVDLSGLAEMLGVNRHLAPIVARSKGFPPPVAELNGGPVWTLARVQRFLSSEACQPDGSEEEPGRGRSA
ncbi:MAG: hypothetical protein M3133_09450 [Actinomycetota bacterium]|nr:hypothetical protein [Actinomycetota bacterium]